MGVPPFFLFRYSHPPKGGGVEGSADQYAGPAGGEPLAEEVGLFWCGWITTGAWSEGGVEWYGD